jgi:hypothetical protein
VPWFGADLAWLVPLRNEPIGLFMAICWHPEHDVTPTPAEVETMASVLEGRHGHLAVGVAEFFSTYHSLGGDAGRCWAWAGVAATIRKRERERLHDHR